MEKEAMQEELDSLHKTLEGIEKAFYLVATHDSKLQAYGLRRLARWFDLGELQPLLESFPVELASCLKIIEIFDNRKYEQFNALLKETKIEDLITRFSVKLRIAQNERSTISPLAMIYSALGIVLSRKITSDLFASENMSMEGALSAITRIKSLLVTIRNDIKDRLNNDDEIFKPSNLKIHKISVEIDAAIINVKQSRGISSSQQDKLIEYLEEAKSELAKKSPAWRKIVGALVIASTLLGGAAVAPQASDNLGKAINYILGTSIQNVQDKQLELPKMENEKQPPEVYSI